MQLRDFENSTTGRLLRVPDTNPRNPTGYYHSFIPNPLPTRMPLDEEATLLLAEAQQYLSELSGTGRTLPNPYLLINPFLRREAILSSRIEGTIADAEQLLLFEIDPDQTPQTPDVEEVFNYVRAMQQAMDEITQTRVSLALIRRAHALLLQGVRGQDKRPGEFRQVQNSIGRPGQEMWEANFVLPTPTAMLPALDDLERFFQHPPPAIPVLVQLALVHYQFEAIHPFLDGNGRIGRMLITLLLCERGLLTGPLLYLSAYLDRHREEYLRHLLAVSQRATWGEWIRFFLRGVAEQSKDGLLRTQRLQDMQREYQRRVRALRTTGILSQLIDELFITPSITISGAADRLGVGFNTAQRAMRVLEAEGIVAERTGRRRGKIYLAPEIVAVISE